MDAQSSARTTAQRVSCISIIVLAGACAGKSVHDGATGNAAGEKSTTAGAAGKSSSSSGGSMVPNAGAPMIGTGGSAGTTPVDDASAAGSGGAGANNPLAGGAGAGGAEDRNTCEEGAEKGKTCEDYCDIYRDKCDGGDGYGRYEENSAPGEGREECLSKCKYYSNIYDGDLCCRLGLAAQGEGNRDCKHCDESVFFLAGPCPYQVRETTCMTGPGSGKTCADFCKVYTDNCDGIGYLGEGDCVGSCMVGSIVDGTLCCRLVEVAQGTPDGQHCSNAYRGRGGSCPAEP